MHLWMRWGLAGVVGFAAALLIGVLLSSPPALTWQRRISWRTKLITGMGERIRKGLTPEAVLQADVLGLSPMNLILMGLTAAVVLGGLTAVFLRPARWLGVFTAIGGFYLGPSWIVGRRFREYQQAMQTAFETHVLLLQIYLSLRQPIATALKTMRGALNGSPQHELDRLLGDMTAGRGDYAFTRWANRTQLPEYRMLADTIIQQRGRGLTGDSLEPLDTLLAANRQQNMRSLTNLLSAGGFIVPMLCALAIATLWLYGLFSGVPGLSELRVML